MSTDFPPEADRRTLRVRGGLKLFRTLRSRGDANQTNAAPRLPLVGASALAPFRLSMLFLFRGGILFEIEWAETGLGRALPLRGKACGSKCGMQNTNAVWCLVFISSLVVVQGTGCHPRHPPRAFPLGLLAPRCLCAVLFLASAPCSALARAPLHLGGGRVPPPSVGLLLAVVCESIQCFSVDSGLRTSLPSLCVPSESALAQPPSSFSRVRVWCRFRYWSSVLQ